MVSVTKRSKIWNFGGKLIFNHNHGIVVSIKLKNKSNNLSLFNKNKQRGKCIYAACMQK